MFHLPAKVIKDRYRLCPKCGNFAHFSLEQFYCMVCGTKMIITKQKLFYHMQRKSLKLALFILFNMVFIINSYAQTTTISGEIKDKITSEPVIHAAISIEGTLFGASSNEFGYYEIKNIPPGKYNLVVSAVGYHLSRIKNVNLSADENLKIDISLMPKNIKKQPNIPQSLPPKGELSKKEEEVPFEEQFLMVVEEMPEIIGRLESIQRNVVYPETAIRAGIEGTVYVMAFVDENGNVVGAEVIKGIGGGCDESAVSAVMKAKFKLKK